MFSFFRRQGKKQQQQGGGNNKKSKKQTSGGFDYINDIQCVPVDKYQFEFCKPFNEDKARIKPAPPPLIINIMGNSESTKKCSTESLDAGYQSDSPTKLSHNVQSSPKTDPKDTEFRWESSTPHKFSTNAINCDSFGTAPSSPVNEVINILKNTGPKVDLPSLSRAKEIFFKSQGSPYDLITAPQQQQQPPLAVIEDLESCDSQNEVKSSRDTNIQVAESEETDIGQAGQIDNVPAESCDCIKFADADEEIDEEVDNNQVEGRERTANPQLSQSSSICSNEDDDDAFHEVENKDENPSSSEPQLRVPNITVTESSDSEGENESDEEFQTQYYSQEQRYDRTYPTFLYDITEVEEPFSDASDIDTNGFNDNRRNFVQEPKIQEQIIKSLKCELETKDSENMQLKGKVNDLQRDVLNKTWGMDRLHAELASFQTETDCVRNKLLKVEDDLLKYKSKNIELNEELLQTLEKECSSKLVNELQAEIEGLKLLIKDLQKELDAAQAEKKRLQMKLTEIEKEKSDRLKTVEMALTEALKQKQKLQVHFDAEYEKLRTLNTDREQQLTDDFEWKLREVEMNCKRKLEDKDKANEEKVKLIRKQLETEIAQLKEQMKKVEKLKSYEAEAIQLRGLTQEQERSLRMATRTADQLHSNQRSLNEEVDKLRSSLEKERAHLATVQGIHSREIAEKDRKYTFKLEQQRNELNAEWEDKIRRETTRLKLDVEKQYKDEKRTIIEEAKTKSEEQLKENNEMWNKKLSECKKELETLDQKLIEREKSYREELVKLQTNSDRDMLELRRKLDKMDLRYQEQLEKKQEKHETEIENLREEYDKRIQQAEQNWAQQVSSTRATLELVKEQLQREAEAQMETLNKKYMMQIEEQHERFAQEKEDAVAEIREKCSKEMCDLQNQLNEELTAQKNKEIEMLNVIDNLKLQLTEKSNNVNTLQIAHDTLHNIITELKERITIYDNLRLESENALKSREAEHWDTLTKIKEQYENEIKQLQSKFNVLENNPSSSSLKEQTCNPESQATNSEDASSQSSQSKSSRRRNRGRHRNSQQKNQQRPPLTHQFSL